MKLFQGFSFNLLSFILGIAAGVLASLIFSRLRRLLPKLKEPLEKQSEIIRMGNLEGMDKYMRQQMLVKSQHMHLAHELFPLNEILVPPRLLASPFTNPPSDQPGIETIASEIIPFLPDCSELNSGYPSNPITIEQAIQNGANLAITGHPGSGKSVVLADFASKLVNHDPSVKKIWNRFPVLLHIQDINLSSIKAVDPLDRIADSMSENLPKLFLRRLPRFLKFMAYHARLILMIDGFDELPPAACDPASKYLYALTKRYPHARIITTASPDHLDGLISIGFHPIMLAGWERRSVNQFLELWVNAWNKYLAPNFNLKSFPQFDPKMLISWLTADYPIHTPMEWTLKIWSALAGDGRGTSSVDVLESYIQRITQSKIPHQKLEGLAHHFVQYKLESLPSNQIEKTLSKIKISSKEAGIEIAAPQGETPEDLPQFHGKKRRRQKTVVNRSSIYSLLLSSGLLVENIQYQTRFSHPILEGYLASFNLAMDSSPQDLHTETRWCVVNQAYRFQTTHESSQTWMPELLKEDDPIYNRTLTISRWVADIPTSFQSRTQILRHIAGVLQNDAVPLFNRARILSAFLASNDPSRTALFKQLFQSRSATIRSLAALGCGAIGDPKVIQDLRNLFHDPDYGVRQAACLAIAQLDYPDVNNQLKDIILNADEDMRRAAAESLAVRGPEEHQMLKEFALCNDLLARRAAVFGLCLIQQGWVIELLEKIAVEDGQWVVRNAASQALDAMQNLHPFIPLPLGKASEAPWLIAFAARNGLGVSPNLPPLAILLLALATGSQTEKLASLVYLRMFTNDEVTAGIYKSILSEKDPLTVIADYYALWYLATSGTRLAPISQFAS